MENKNKSDTQDEIVDKVEEGHLVAIHKYLDIIDRAHREVEIVRGVYKWLATCLTIIIVAGGILTYANLRDMRSDMRESIKIESEYMKSQIDYIKTKTSQEIDLLSSKLNYQLERNISDIEKKVQSRIDQEFKSENIRKLIEIKAQEYTEKNAHKFISEKVDESIKPISTSLKQMEQEAKKANDKIKDTEIKMEEQNSILTKQVDDWKKRSKLMQLADDAISDGNAESLYELSKYEETDMRLAAAGEIIRVKITFLAGSRILDKSLTITDPDGTNRTGGQIKTSELIGILKTDGSWENRARAARLLGNRHQKSVPDSLLEACLDKKLDVIKEALQAFSAITTYQGDVLECKNYKNWWLEKKSSIDERLKPLDSK